ncbi:hypothetical protein FOCG_07412 [Fusarium oxysporum f. sp. radicis-lycopersici 26381]|nr:hypothetical protein FOCG_07412 [Fusarium oxysporum f. sp. radicis-lycopersici 26381]RKL51851.1 hypothetical protein BFJ70_g566 [Fusarium oxysporum]
MDDNLTCQGPLQRDVAPSAETPESESSAARARQSPLETRKRGSLSEPDSLRKSRKVSRACDFCKARKAKCSGEQPCAKCATKGLICSYETKYTRGRPPTPPPSTTHGANDSRVSQPPNNSSCLNTTVQRQLNTIDAASTVPQRSAGVGDSKAPSRASPEVSVAEIQGQVFDPTSGLTFLHRALKRFSDQRKIVAQDNNSNSAGQTAMTGGDKPLPSHPDIDGFKLPDPVDARFLLTLYFDVCIATYRILHKSTVETWLSTMEQNMQSRDLIWKGLGRAKAAIVLVVLAIGSLHRAKSEGFLSTEAEDQALAKSDTFFTISARLVDEETNSGFPRLESAQAKLIQVLYLLTTSRFNQGWYMFGNVLQLVSALGLHRRIRRHSKSSMDYIRAQCDIRTFWTTYILDNYLGVIFGRPRHYHDDDIDQDYPDRVDDDDMTPAGPLEDFEEQQDCSIDALIFHAKIARIIGSISRQVYSPQDKSIQDRCAAADRLARSVHDWHSDLPVHLGSVRPSMLIPRYRRQATVLKLAHSHAIMHANRLCLLKVSSSGYESQINECIEAAKSVLQAVDHLAQEGPIFHAFWWTHYVTFCALMVTYVWEAQQRRTFGSEWEEKTSSRRLIRLAERCQMHLANATASNSPSRRYAVILEELRTTASMETETNTTQANAGQMNMSATDDLSTLIDSSSGTTVSMGQEFGGFENLLPVEVHPLDEWDTMDWLALDSSAFWPYFDGDTDEASNMHGVLQSGIGNMI